jgi:hypothetical protein
LYSDELHDLYCPSSITRVIILKTVRWARNVARMGQWRGAYRSFMETADEKILHGRPRCRWDDNIKTYLEGIGWAWTGLILLRAGQVSSCCQHYNESSIFIKFREYLD